MPRDRLDGFKRALPEAGIPTDIEQIRAISSPIIDAAYQQTDHSTRCIAFQSIGCEQFVSEDGSTACGLNVSHVLDFSTVQISI